MCGHPFFVCGTRHKALAPFGYIVMTRDMTFCQSP